MKVWLLLSRMECGGLERVQINLAKGLSNIGIEVHLVIGKIVTDLTSEIPTTVTVKEIARKGRIHFIPGLLLALRHSKPDVIFTTSNDVACIILALRSAKLCTPRVIVTQHLSISGPKSSSKGLRRWKFEGIRYFMRKLFPSSEEIVAVSAGVANDMRKQLSLKNKNIKVIYNPVVDETFSQRMRAPTPWPWPDRTVPTIIFVGRLAPVKRLDLLLEAFQLVTKKIPSRMLIVGTGPQVDATKTKIKSLGLEQRCKLTGVIENPLPLIRASNLLVLPSDYEGFGNVLVEAMACGTQVVSTNCPHGPAEILENGKFGQLVPCGNTDALAQAIIRSLSDTCKYDRNSLIERAKSFNFDRAVTEYARLIYKHNDNYTLTQ